MLECGQFCLREENCAAFNYETRDQGPSRECELKDLRNSSVRYDVELTCDENYDYITMENVSLVQNLGFFCIIVCHELATFILTLT